ncbi:alpha/beta hydrolase [Gloeomargarita lithophora Alchichica-D10]|uniref:Alpha/beta hydrolase n=1 Tax=Gloeomargarita lithophora Alchichica-D10 TaxID=1188229 RepID=A0A1J0AE81_9CYAN|nr:alpha/beta fold hydrolase [Gloeomargarita lithophora]APB34244.1 alpha/beta hydrolase [Gloeomargarita lithophora Alchichica-D10]
MTLYTTWATRQLDRFLLRLEYQDYIFTGYEGVPIFGRWSVPPGAKGTIIATYGITGSLENQGLLYLWAYRAFERGYGVLLFDWRAHGKTGQLSPALPSDGMNEGQDYLALAVTAQKLGCPPPYWFAGYSLGGQLALWAGWAAMAGDSPLPRDQVGGVIAVCPNLDAGRSLPYLMAHPWGRYVEQAITRSLKQLARQLYLAHPQHIDGAAIARAHSIWTFDQELVIPPLGFTNVVDYYASTSPLRFLRELAVPTLILYASDDPLFAPAIIPDLERVCAENPHVNLVLTKYGGHVGYYNSRAGQQCAQDPDRWWAWYRVLDWLEQKLPDQAT